MSVDGVYIGSEWIVPFTSTERNCIRYLINLKFLIDFSEFGIIISGSQMELYVELFIGVFFFI